MLNTHLIKIYFHLWLCLGRSYDSRLYFFFFRKQSLVSPTPKRLHSDVLKINNLVISKKNLSIRDKLLKNWTILKVTTWCELFVDSSSAFFGFVTKWRASSTYSRRTWWIVVFALYYRCLVSLATDAHMTVTSAIAATATLLCGMILMPFYLGDRAFFFRWLIISVFHF
jgi:hypothetical protein